MGKSLKQLEREIMAEKADRGWKNPAFQSSHVPRLREIQNTPSFLRRTVPPPRRPALPGGDSKVEAGGYTTPTSKNRSTGIL